MAAMVSVIVVSRRIVLVGFLVSWSELVLTDGEGAA